MNETYNSELYHHGVLGMKWGVRRYQNKDGSLTLAGKNRFREVASNSRLNKKNTKTAIKILKNNRRIYRPDRQADYYYRKADRAKNKGDSTKYEEYSKRGKQYAELSQQFNKKISDIESGKLKAGRDFITQRDYDYNVAWVSITNRMIEK